MADDKENSLINPVPPKPPASLQIATVVPSSQQTAETLLEIDDTSWERSVEKSNKPVAVMFYSPACVFCHQIEPYFRNYAQEFHEGVVFASDAINVTAKVASRLEVGGGSSKGSKK